MRRNRPAAGSGQPAARTLTGARLAAIGALVLVAACSGSEGTSTTTPSSSTTSTSAAATTTPTTPATTMSAPATTTTTAAPGTTAFRGNTVTTSGSEDGQQGGHLVDVTVEEHDGFTRVIFEVDGPGTPFWQAGPTQRPFFIDNDVAADRAVAGSAYIGVILYPAEVGAEFRGSMSISLSDGPIAEIAFIGNGTNGSHWVIGTRGEKPFLGATYRSPARLELDIGD